MTRAQTKYSDKYQYPLFILCAAFIAVVFNGCNDSVKVTPDALMRDYNAHRYQQCLNNAEPLIKKSHSNTRDTARYFAGLSAYQLGMNDKAYDYLIALSFHTDRKISGPANATLGLICIRRNEDQRAINYLIKASKQLTGNKAWQALYHRGVAEQKLGWWSTAKTHLQAALDHTIQPDKRNAIRQRIKAKAFTLQLGAFSDKNRAYNRSHLTKKATDNANLPTPTVVTTVTSKNKTLYLIQAGRFNTYANALKAKQKLRDKDVWIVTTDSAD